MMFLLFLRETAVAKSFSFSLLHPNPLSQGFQDNSTFFSFLSSSIKYSNFASEEKKGEKHTVVMGFLSGVYREWKMCVAAY
jgi:Zn-dependent M28 family amino/carboxypeptidase